ncbi:MAG: acyltransferase family protein [Rhizobiaceae bacterium]|nr:acyltransferase family protein [Rhizobiaceae bacterium]
MQMLGKVCEGRENGFNFLRLFAAVGILFAHCLLAVPIINESSEILPRDFRFAADLLLAVFFVFSGFLITASRERNQNLVRFATARILRIYPALITVSLGLILLIGPLVTTVPLVAYFSDTNTYLYLIRSVLFLDASASLPGVFTTHPVAHAVNLPIWTLRYEVVIYAVYPIAAILFINRSLSIKGGAKFAALIGCILVQQLLGESDETGGLEHLMNFSASFLIGSLLWTYRHFIPGSVVVVAFLWALFWLSTGLGITYFLGVLAAGYSFIWIAFLDIASLKTYGKFGDYSYGTYVMHFPIAQAIYGMNPAINPYVLGLFTLALTLPIAVLSWRVVEMPALSQVKNCSALISSKLSYGSSVRA